LRPDLEQYYLIDQYLENKLKGAELTAFEEQLQNNASFAEEVAEQRMLNNLILEAELKSVRSQIAQDLASIQSPSFFRMHWQWIGMGLLSLSAILYFIIPSADSTNKTIIKQSPVYSSENKNTPSIEVAEKSAKIPSTHNIEKNTAAITAGSATDVHAAEVSAGTNNNLQSVKNTEIITSTTITPPANTNVIPLIETKPAEVVKTIDCSVTKISFSVTTETSCHHSETGSIYIDNLSGGIAPYSFTLNNKKIKEKNISNLGAGTYEVKISDRNGCSAEHTAIISEKNCTPAIQQGLKFNINPAIGETCNIPFDADKKGNITIYNRSGKIIYRVTNPSTDSVEWTGTDGYGALAEAGLYVYLIEYTDGTKVTGEVNIIR
jgi:hypothetical protein